ncbi:hypothetical protein VUR80DRAFT_5112 [Thermomyces stellatus]
MCNNRLGSSLVSWTPGSAGYEYGASTLNNRRCTYTYSMIRFFDLLARRSLDPGKPGIGARCIRFSNPF